jgi:hypothetical protein
MYQGLPHFLENRLTDGGEDVGLMRQSPFTTQEDSWYSFQRLSRPQGHISDGRIGSIEIYSDLIGNRNCDLPACSMVPQPTTLPRAPTH